MRFDPNEVEDRLQDPFDLLVSAWTPPLGRDVLQTYGVDTPRTINHTSNLLDEHGAAARDRTTADYIRQRTPGLAWGPPRAK